MSNQTVEAPRPVGVPLATGQRRARVSGARAIRALMRCPWLAGAATLLACSAVIVVWARVRPGYDPYGWLVWGKLSVHLALDTNGAPSWKPLPFLFTVPYALFGRFQLWLWMITAVAISLSGPIFAWRIAFRLTGAAPERRYAAYAAGLFAAALVLGMQDVVGRLTYVHYVLSAESDTIIVALCLAAIDCHLAARHRWAFWMWWLAALGRPEVWPFAAVAAIWLWRSTPGFRRWLIAALAMQLLLWFGVPALTSKSAFTAGNVAQNSPRAVHGNKIIGTINRFRALQPTAVWVAAAVTVVVAALQRNRLILALAAGALVWIAIEIAFSLGGFPSVPRYMFEAGAIVAVLSGVFVGWLILALPPLLARTVPRLSPELAGWATGVAVVAFAGSMFGFLHRQYRMEQADLGHERDRAVLINRLSTVVSDLGTHRILACGQPHIPIEYQSILAWYTDIKVGELYVSQRYEQLHPHPLVNIYPTSGLGWKVFPSHLSVTDAGRCGGLQSVLPVAP